MTDLPLRLVAPFMQAHGLGFQYSKINAIREELPADTAYTNRVSTLKRGLCYHVLKGHSLWERCLTEVTASAPEDRGIVLKNAEQDYRTLQRFIESERPSLDMDSYC